MSPVEERTTRFPIPLVGAAAMLAVLLVLTPVLITGGAGGTLLAQAELIVDHAPGSLNTTFLIRSVGNVRYSAIDVGTNATYVPGSDWRTIAWQNWTNVSEVVGLSIALAGSDAAVNVTVLYHESSGPTVAYYGVVGTLYNGGFGTIRILGLSPGITTPSGSISTGSAGLPYAVSLEYLGAVGSPP